MSLVMILRYGENRDGGGGSNEVRGRGGGAMRCGGGEGERIPSNSVVSYFSPKIFYLSSPLTANEKLPSVLPPGCISSIWFFSMSSLQVVYR